MRRRILFGVDTNLSPPTQHALTTVGEFFEQASPPVYLVLLHVIPFSQVAPLHPGIYGQALPLTATSWQRKQADEALAKARAQLQQHGYTYDHIEEVVRVGIPADEIVKAARELRVNWIVIGSRGSSWRQRLRRFFIGSLSRRILQLTPCPVMIVVLPNAQRPANLVTWYESAITTYLEEHNGSLTVFTPRQVAQQFVPPTKSKRTEEAGEAGRKEVEAARLALEQLAEHGLLFRHEVQGELHYVND